MELRTDSITGAQHAVVYSLGNFISNMSKVNTDGGLIFTLELETFNSLVFLSDGNKILKPTKIKMYPYF